VSIYVQTNGQECSPWASGYIDLRRLESSTVFQELSKEVKALEGKQFFVAFEMWREGKTTGQISRHYSPGYVNGFLLEGYRVNQSIELPSALCCWLRCLCKPHVPKTEYIPGHKHLSHTASIAKPRF
jgi:hypothetical protein